MRQSVDTAKRIEKTEVFRGAAAPSVGNVKTFESHKSLTSVGCFGVRRCPNRCLQMTINFMIKRLKLF